MSVIVVDTFDRLQFLVDCIQDIPSIKEILIVDNNTEKIKELNAKFDGKVIVTSVEDTMVRC